MIALFIGRFQPFHLGHLNIIKEISKDYSKIIIGIGSSQYSNTIDNPFSFDTRKKMITDSLNACDIKNYEIVDIPDIHDPPNWAAHVKSFCPKFDVVITNSVFNKRLFSNEGFKVKNTKIYNRSRYSGKEIRNRIINKTKWEHLVPESVKNIIKDIDGEEKLINIYKNEQ